MLKEKLMEDLKEAMKEKEVLKKNVVQMIRAAILQVEKDKQIELNDDQILEIIAKEAKKRKESLADYEKSGREDLINQVKEEIEIINKYLPEQMEKEEIEKIVKEIVEETGATTIKDLGKVMKIAKERIGTRADGKDISNEFIKSIFKETKIKVTIENKMNDYLKTHACAVLPLVFASYKVDGNLKLLKKDKEYSLLIMDAIIEGYDVLKKLGYEILPKGEYENCVNKKEKCAFIYRFMFSNFIGKMCISDHAMSAREEFILLDNEFEKLKKKSKLETKVYDKLRLDFLNYKN